MTGHLTALGSKLATEMPVTLHLGIQVVGYADGCLTLAAPLAANRNHKGAAFAGSLNAIATLAGWATVWLAVRDEGLDAHVVIQDSATKYLRPVHEDFVASAKRPDRESLATLFQAVRKRGRGRVAVSATVSDGIGEAVTFTGRYVVQLAAPGSDSTWTPLANRDAIE